MDLELLISELTQKLNCAEQILNVNNQLFNTTTVQIDVLKIINGLKKAENDYFGHTQPFSTMDISREGLIAFLRLLKDDEYFKANGIYSSKEKSEHSTKEDNCLSIYLTLGRGVIVELIFRESVKETIVGCDDKIGHYTITKREIEESCLTSRQYTSIEDMRLYLDDDERIMYFSDSRESVILPFYHPTEELKKANNMRLSQIIRPISTDELIKRNNETVMPEGLKELKLQ